MIKTKRVFRARASLIDRLIDLHPKAQRESKPLRMLGRSGLKESIRRDLSWLLNTRTSLPASEFDDRQLTVIDFGIPDFGSYYTANENDRVKMNRRLVRAISFFEPRLRNVTVAVDTVMLNEKALRIMIDAEMVVEDVRAPVSFLTILQDKSATLEINENR